MQLSRLLPPAAVLILTLGVAFPTVATEQEPATPGTLAAVGQDGAIVDLPLRHTNVSIEISAFVARTTVEQVFVNPFDHPIEVTYTFPLGHEAAVDQFEMQSGDRVIRGEIHRRGAAREIYEAARSEGQQAALLEQERPNVFTQSVANLLPAGEVRVRLRTVEIVEYDAGQYELTFPLVVGPRYVPGELLEEEAATGGSAQPIDPSSDVRRINSPRLPQGFRSGHDVDIHVALDAGVPLRSLASASHAIEIDQEDPERANVTLSPSDRIPNKDFILRWKVASDEPVVGLLAHRDGVDGYFALVVQPRGSVPNEQAAPKEILFVLDTSGSMNGTPLRMSKAFIRDALRSLGRRDTFNLIQFASGSSTYSEVSLEGTEENVSDALKWVRGLKGSGGTEMLKGLERAIHHGEGTTRYRMIIFLTDGYIGNENQILGRIKTLPDDVRVFTIGIGSSVNHALLDGMARLGGGAYTFIPNDRDASASLDRLTKWVTRPYLTDLEIDWGALPVGDWIPEIPRDLFSGQNLSIVGRYFGAADGSIVLRGRLAGEYWEKEVQVSLPDTQQRHGALAAVWARARIQALLDDSPAESNPFHREEIVELALEHQLMSPFTSFVAVDYEVVNPGGESEIIHQPVPAPDGTSFEGNVSSGISVQVTDPDGLPLPGATVTISNRTGLVAKTAELTRPDGAVDFPILAPGDGYAVQVAFPGFSPIRYEDLRVQNGTGALLAIQMIEEFREKVRVVAEADVIDLDAAYSSTRFSDQFIADLPVPGRFYQNVMTMMPGVQDADGDGNPNVHGSRSRDFNTKVGGVSNVDPLSGQWISRINANSIEEIEVITAGAGVEFGRAQGGFARIIQKQGSNTHEGIINLEAGSDDLDAIGSRTIPASYDGVRGGLHVAGPIAKDRLWYRASHEWIDRSDPVQAGRELVVAPQTSASHSDMLTWQASPRNKLQFHGQWQTEESRRVGVSSFVRTEATPRIDRNERVFSLHWIAPYSPKILVETVLSQRDTGFARMPAGALALNGCVAPEDPFLGRAECLDLIAGAQSGTAHRSFAEDHRRYGLESKATIYGGRMWGMTHEFKLGVDIGRERHDRTLARDPNLVRVSRAGTETVLARTGTMPLSTSGADAHHWTLFVEDQLKPAENLTLTAGLRVDSESVESEGFSPFDPRVELERFITDADGLTGDERVAFAGGAFTGPVDLGAFLDGVGDRLGENLCCSDPIIGPGQITSPRAPVRMRLDDLNFSPFFSIKWAPGANGRTALSFAARRYFDKLLPVHTLVETEPVTADVVVADATGSVEPFVRPSVQLIDRGLQTPYQDEWIVTYERELFPETSLAVSWVQRSFDGQIQQLDLNHLPGDYGRCVAPNNLGQTAVVPVDDPADPLYGMFSMGGDGILDDCNADGIPDSYVQSPLWGDVFLTGNFGSGTYKGLVVELDRRQYRSWELHASYTYSVARGTAEAFDPLLGDERTLLENRAGFQSYDQRHVFKLHTTVITPWGIRLGGSVAWESGLPYSNLEHRLMYDAISPALEGLTQSIPVPRLVYTSTTRNLARNNPFLNVDLRLIKEFSIGSGITMRCRVDLLNALDDRSYRIYPGERAYGRIINGFPDATSRFGRRYQVGLEFSF